MKQFARRSIYQSSLLIEAASCGERAFNFAYGAICRIDVKNVNVVEKVIFPSIYETWVDKNNCWTAFEKSVAALTKSSEKFSFIDRIVCYPIFILSRGLKFTFFLRISNFWLSFTEMVEKWYFAQRIVRKKEAEKVSSLKSWSPRNTQHWI